MSTARLRSAVPFALACLVTVVALAQDPPAVEKPAPPAGPYPSRTTRPGAEPQAVALVDDALAWLARHQADDGHWSALAWGERCSKGEECRASTELSYDRGLPGFDAGVTALAALAFLGHGHIPAQGKHAAVVEKALRWLVAHQGPDGAVGTAFGADPNELFGRVGLEHGVITIRRSIPFARVGESVPEPPPTIDFAGGPVVPGWTLYNHALGTQALCEALALTGDDAWRAPATKAVGYCMDTRNLGLGWHYGPRAGVNDSSLTAWMAQAIRAAHDAKLSPPPGAHEGCLAWFGRVTGEDGRAGYRALDSGPSGFRAGEQMASPEGDLGMTAASAFVRVLLGDKVPSAGLRAVGKLFKASPPAFESAERRAPFQYAYFGASYLALRPSDVEGRRWRAAQLQLLATASRRDGCARGSFEPTEVWCYAGGRVYATAIGALGLEAPWRLGGVRPLSLPPRAR